MPIIRDQLAKVILKVRLYLSVSRFDVAEKLLKSTLSDHGPLAHITNLLGLTFHKQSRFTEAVNEYKKALQANPEFIEASLNLTVTLCDLSRYDEARELFETLQPHARPSRQVPLLNLGRIANLHADCALAYDQAGMSQEAIQEYRKAIALYPNLPDVQLALARLYLRSNIIDKAQIQLEELIKSGDLSADAQSLLGLIYRKKGRTELARGCWLKAQELNPGDATSRAYLRISDAETSPQN